MYVMMQECTAACPLYRDPYCGAVAIEKDIQHCFRHFPPASSLQCVSWPMTDGSWHEESGMVRL